MREAELFLLFIRPMNQAGIRYVVTGSVAAIFYVIHIDTGFKAGIYLTGRDELNAWAFRGKRSVQFEGETVVLAPPEYVIIRKLEFYREGGSEKHLRDIRSMLAISGDQMDRSALDQWIQHRALQPQWTQVQVIPE